MQYTEITHRESGRTVRTTRLSLASEIQDGDVQDKGMTFDPRPPTGGSSASRSGGMDCARVVEYLYQGTLDPRRPLPPDVEVVREIRIATIGAGDAWQREIAPTWDPNACSTPDYDTDRARRLYEALGASMDDDEWCLCRHADGRWALIGLTQSRSRYAYEI